MPRSRVSEMAQRQQPRPPTNLRTSTSSSDNNNRPRTTPKLGEGRSPRGPQSDPANKKKLGTRIADLESQLGLAQEELKSLKTQIVSTDPDKNPPQDDKIVSNQQETDVFEVPMEEINPETKTEPELSEPEPENPLVDELVVKNEEINSLKADLDEKDKQLEFFREENESLKRQLDEKSVKMTSAQSEIDEMSLKLKKADQEVEKSKSWGLEINEKLEAAEKAKVELESEMNKLRVQTEQWRKAADAAASVLSGGRCGSMDNKQFYGNGFESGRGYPGYVGSPGLFDDPDNDNDDEFGSGKRKGIKMFGDLWKKKGQK